MLLKTVCLKINFKVHLQESVHREALPKMVVPSAQLNKWEMDFKIHFPFFNSNNHCEAMIISFSLMFHPWNIGGETPSVSFSA